MKSILTRLVALLALSAGASLPVLGGCNGAQKFDIGLTSKATQKVEVDLIAVPENEADTTWRAKNLDDYFSGNDTLRSDHAERTKSYTFTEGQSARITINKDDPIWNKWDDKRPLLVVLANSRSLRAEAQKAGGQDPRRNVIPLNEKYWSEEKKFEITVTDGGIQVNPPPQPR